MARLNEAAPPPVESVDALKRRFVRQNRELTKANTTQSLRIRTLELETSRLLSENLALRSQIIALQHQSHTHQSRAHAVLAVKNQLETKIEELGRLVCGLGDTAASDQVLADGGTGAANGRGPARSPDPRNWKNTLSLSDVAGGAHGHGHGQGVEGSGRLPVILEDKYYPRRTMKYVLRSFLEHIVVLFGAWEAKERVLIDPSVPVYSAEELINLLSGPGTANGTAAADSPDLGPPPVAHFESEEVPIRFDQNSMPETGEIHAEQEDGNPVLSANLETRKRRKDGGSNASELVAAKGAGSAYGVEKSRSSAASAGKEELGLGQSLDMNLNPSAKRKLSVRDGEEVTEEVAKLTGKDEFVYDRRRESKVLDDGARERENKQDGNVGNAKIAGDLPGPRGASCSSRGRDGTAASTGASVRKALEPKSANTDPLSSPTKNGKHAAVNNEKMPNVKKDTAKKGRERERHRERDKKPTAINNPNHTEPKLKHEPSPSQSLPPPPPPPSTNAETLTDLPPKTPASLDLFSPQPSTEPSVPRPDSRDTPPPTDLHPPSSTTTDVFNTAGRPSRRPRAGVSYAEPNLRDKMRRPTRALADAVGAEERVQRALNGNRAGSESRDGNADGDGGAVEGARIRTVVIKKENVAEPAWKFLPSSDESTQQQQQQQQQQRYRAGAVTSPLDDRPRTTINGIGNGNANANGDLPPSVMTARRHRASSVHRTEGTDEPNEASAKYASTSVPTSVGGTTIAALVAGTARKRERMMKQQQQQMVDGATNDEDKILDSVPETEGKLELDIYDFHASEPAANLVDDDDDDDDGDGAKLSNDRSGGINGASRASRRHSAMPLPSSSRHTVIASNPIATASENDLGSGATVRVRPSSRTSGRRRGTLGLDGAGDDPAVGEGGGDERDGGVLARARSVLDLKSGSVVADGDAGRGRAERVAARRRSMML